MRWRSGGAEACSRWYSFMRVGPARETRLNLGAYLGPVELVECFADLDWAAD
jgi:hypothetical protein